MNQPPPKELTNLYWKRLTPLLTYLLEPTPALAADGFVYVCKNQQYDLKGLDHGVQGNVKRGLREFQIRSTTLDEVLRSGERAFLDTWQRHGSGTSVSFRKYLTNPATLCGNRFVGAWREGELASFAGLIEADDWVEVRVRFSTDASLKYRPNDALLFHILSFYLAGRKFRIVCAGTSSVQPSANTPGLHRFKVKLGFEAVPVRRVFCFHPVLRPFVCRASLSLFAAAANRSRGNYRLELAEQVVRHYLGIPQAPISEGERSP